MARSRATSRRQPRSARAESWIVVADESAPAADDASDDIERNRAAWDEWARDQVAAARKAWNDTELHWGIWGIPESELRLLEEFEPETDVVELGCGTAAVSAWLARLGMRPVAVDFSRRQLETAEWLQREFGPSFPLIHALGEDVPYDTESFDLAVSEYGVSHWSDPKRWLPEVHRLLRPGGKLIFFTNGAMLIACTAPDGSPAGERLQRGYFSSYRIEFPDDGTVEFHPTHGHWISLLLATGFVVEGLLEVRPPHGAKPRLEFASADWARQWPSEEIWIARKAF
jgi:SAM-dependent methyltransferase